MQPQRSHNVLAAASSRQSSCELAISPDDVERQRRTFWALLRLLQRGNLLAFSQQHVFCAQTVLLAPAQHN